MTSRGVERLDTDDVAGAAPLRAPRPALDPTVKALGVVTFLNGLSSEVAVRTLPLFLANVLGVKTGIIGLIEGLAESTATLLNQTLTFLLPDTVGEDPRQDLEQRGHAHLWRSRRDEFVRIPNRG